MIPSANHRTVSPHASTVVRSTRQMPPAIHRTVYQSPTTISAYPPTTSGNPLAPNYTTATRSVVGPSVASRGAFQGALANSSHMHAPPSAAYSHHHHHSSAGTPSFVSVASHAAAPSHHHHQHKKKKKNSDNSGKKKKDRKSRHSGGSKKESGSSWKSIFCMDDGGGCHGGDGDCGGSFVPSWCGGSSSPPKKSKVKSRGVDERDRPMKGFDQIRLQDGTTFDFEEDSEDWDLFQNPFSRGPERDGPERKSSTDLEFSIRDLFPCFGDVFDLCGCAKKKKERAHVMPRSAGGHKHPQLETVCLECGHVLEQQRLGKSVLRDAAGHVHWNGWGPGERGAVRRGGKPPPASQFEFGYGETPREWDRKSTYSGYEGWDLDGGDSDSGGSSPRRRMSDDKVPLPQFHVDDPRKFRTRPGRVDRSSARWVDSDCFDIDDTGRVALPQFGKREED